MATTFEARQNELDEPQERDGIDRQSVQRCLYLFGVLSTKLGGNQSLPIKQQQQRFHAWESRLNATMATQASLDAKIEQAHESIRNPILLLLDITERNLDGSRSKPLSSYQIHAVANSGSPRSC